MRLRVKNVSSSQCVQSVAQPEHRIHSTPAAPIDSLSFAGQAGLYFAICLFILTLSIGFFKLVSIALNLQ